jgi:3-hydroxyisobutyrate dehydrogenase-like beta-hydroxyacid dehydrogenase
MQVGIIGVGRMGGAIATSLSSRQWPLIVFDRSPGAVARMIELGAEPGESPAAVAAGSSVTLVVVVDDGQVREVATGPGGLFEGAAAGSTVLVVSTVRPETCRELGALATARGIELLDAPVTGGVERAAAGKLTTFAGGEEAALERARPVIEGYSSRVIHLGPLGSGQVGKLANNMMSIANMAVIVEALALAEANGLDKQAVIAAALAGSGASNSLQGYPSWHELGEPGPDPRRPVALKDLDLAMELAAGRGLELPVTAAAAAFFRRLEDEAGREP